VDKNIDTLVIVQYLLNICIKIKNIEIPSNQTKITIKSQNPKDKTIT